MKGLRFWLIFGLFFVFSLSFLCVTLQALLLEKSFLVEQKRDKVENLLATEEKLKVEIARLSSLDRIKDVAINQLGMTYPDETIYMVSSSALGGGEGELVSSKTLKETQGE
ncbi:MAG: septum formation initiator family protein [Candidatus Atribacteria bacterium]|nr:septum formation initiator family protein [Candidatus Atribacteria bacterium]